MWRHTDEKAMSRHRQKLGSCTVLIGAATVENSMEVSQKKLKNIELRYPSETFSLKKNKFSSCSFFSIKN